MGVHRYWPYILLFFPIKTLMETHFLQKWTLSQGISCLMLIFIFQKLTRVDVETLESQAMAREKAQASDMETSYILSAFQPLSW